MPRTRIPTGGLRVAEHMLYDSRAARHSTGNIFYVDSNVSSEGSGLSPESAFNTIDEANNASGADTNGSGGNNGDIVYVMEGHAQNITASVTLTADLAGVSFIGLGSGRSRPVFTWTATASQIVVSAANVLFKNIVFDLAGIDAVVAGFSITGADCTFEDCEFITNKATAGAVLGILTAATATRFTVRRCNFFGTFSNSGTTTTAQIKHEVGVDYVIEDNYFVGKVTNNILNATAITNGLIRRNFFHTGTGVASISMHASSAGFISENRMCVASGTDPIVGAAMSYSGNRYTTEGNGPTGGTADAI